MGDRQDPAELLPERPPGGEGVVEDGAADGERPELVDPEFLDALGTVDRADVDHPEPVDLGDGVEECVGVAGVAVTVRRPRRRRALGG